MQQIDARESNFTDIRGDQVNHFNIVVNDSPENAQDPSVNFLNDQDQSIVSMRNILIPLLTHLVFLDHRTILYLTVIAILTLTQSSTSTCQSSNTD